MAITATFTADFSQFASETKKAEQNLTTFEAAAGQAGEKLAAVGDSAEQAAPKVAEVGKTTTGMETALKQMGVRLPPTVRDMDALGTSALEAVKNLGAVTTAMLAFQTFEAGWKVGRKIAEALGTDEVIGNAVAGWLGWGDVATQTAGAVADEIALANTRVDYHITRIEDARRVNDDFRKGIIQRGKDNEKAAKEEQKAFDDMQAAIVRVNIATQDHDAILASMNPKLVEAAGNALKHGASQRDVAAALLMTGSEIAAVVEHIKKETAALEEFKRKEQEVTEAIKQHWAGVGSILDDVMGVDKLQKATAWKDAIDAMGGSVAQLRGTELAGLRQAMLEGIDALGRMGALTTQQSSDFAALAIKAAEAEAALRPLVSTTEDLVKAQWEYVTALDEETRAQKAAGEAAKEKSGGGFQAGLVPNAIVGRNGVALDMFGRPVVAGGGISQLPVVNISVDGHIIGTEAELARLVGNALSGAYSKGGNRQPV